MTLLLSHLRSSRAARATLLGLGAAFLLSSPVLLGTASAQIPEVDPCLQDPASCLPEVPELPQVDPCLENPASCLPESPSFDPCAEDPASCLSEPEVDRCLEDPESCLPAPPKLDGCTADAGSCLPRPSDVRRCAESPSECLPGGDGGRDRDEDEAGGIVPGGSGNRPERSAETAAALGGTPPAVLTSTGDSAAFARQTEAISSSSGEPAGLLDRIGRGLIDAAQRFKFPLVVAAAVAAFLIVQDRIDRKDPKLAAAPIDSRDDLVTFR